MRILLILACLKLVLPLYGAEDALNVTTPSDYSKSTAVTNAPLPTSGPNDGRIANMTARLLEQVHYLHQPFDAQLSSRFLDRYLDTLDPQHIHFLQSDVAEFDSFRNSLGVLTIKHGDTSPAYLIFDRFMQRMDEQTAYVDDWLKTGPFDFTSSERVMLSRKDQPYPKDLTEAQQFWRDRVRYEYLQERLNLETPAEMAKLLVSRHDGVAQALTWQDAHEQIVKTISKRYSRTMRYFREWDGDKVLETYLTSLAHVYDPHSDYFDKSDLENFSINMSLSLFGIGAVLQSEDGYCIIKELNPSGPAFKSKKIKPNDRIVAVAQGDKEPVDVVDMPLNKVVDQIRGPKGTEVRLTIIPADAADPSMRKVISLVRDEIKLEDQAAKAKIIDLPDGKGQSFRIGVIDLPSFYASFPLMGSTDKAEVKSTTTDVDKLLTKLEEENVKGVILDLRRNGGGSLEEAINLTGLFIKEGPVVQIRDPDGDVHVDEDKDPRIQYDGPLIVLTTRFSASASEITAGALQDYGRALLVGDASTHGKGTVQSLNQLAPYIFASNPFGSTNDPNSLGALKLTTRKFYRASGSSTQLKGVVPDIILPSIDDYMELGEASLDNPLAWDTIESAKYDKLDRVQPYLPTLTKLSNDRVAKEKDFDYVREDIEQVKKAVADKSISLNEVQRLKEKEEADARSKAREQELKSRKPLDETVYDINLKQAELPPGQLPDPEGKGDQADSTATKTASPNGSDTNTAAIAAAAPAGDDDDDDVDAEKPPASVDVNLVEAEHIMEDYVSLLPKATLSVNH